MKNTKLELYETLCGFFELRLWEHGRGPTGKEKEDATKIVDVLVKDPWVEKAYQDWLKANPNAQTPYGFCEFYNGELYRLAFLVNPRVKYGTMWLE